MTRYIFDGFAVDTDRHEVIGPDGSRSFEPQVFDVIRHLLEADGRLVAKNELLDAVWGHRFVTESAMTTQIKNARRLLDDNGQAQRTIRTVRGRGYQFVADVAISHRPPDGRPRRRSLQRSERRRSPRWWVETTSSGRCGRSRRAGRTLCHGSGCSVSRGSARRDSRRSTRSRCPTQAPGCCSVAATKISWFRISP